MKERVFLSPPHMSGREARFIQEAFQSNYIAPLGPQVDAFEKEFCEKVGISHAVALSSGTAAMHLAMHNIGIEPGDEVWASTLTFIGSVTPITFLGGTPVFIDSDRTSWNMDPSLLSEELEACREKGRLPRAVIPTDLYGQCSDMEKIVAICAPYHIPVIADAAEALGASYQVEDPRLQGVGSEERQGCDESQARGEHPSGGAVSTDGWRHAGAGATAAIYSFNGNKIITTSGGGMLASDDEAFIERARFLSQQARDAAPHYEHSTIGFNYRMSNVLAAIGRGQLTVLDDRVKRKREIFEHYRQALSDLPGIEFMPEASYGRSSRWLTVILVSPEEFGADRETLRLALEAENIESRPVWKPMHLQPVFDIPRDRDRQNQKIQDAALASGAPVKRIPARVVGGAVSEDLFARGLCLPSGTQMSERDLERVVDVIRRVQGNRRL
jgi:dTDP-4-amino-4,6-dideoxygalactose transaminase